MRSAELVNIIINKLRIETVSFFSIQEIVHNCKQIRTSCDIHYCHHTYVVNGSDIQIYVHERDGEELVCTSHSNWIEGILNNKVRNDAGELVEVGAK